VRRVIALELGAPEAAPHSRTDPLLKAPVAGGPGAELVREGLPLTAGAQHVEDPIEHAPERDHGTPRRPQRLLGGQQRATLFPEGVGQPPEGRRGVRIIMASHGRSPPSPEGLRKSYAAFEIGSKAVVLSRAPLSGRQSNPVRQDA